MCVHSQLLDHYPAHLKTPHSSTTPCAARFASSSAGPRLCSAFIRLTACKKWKTFTPWSKRALEPPGAVGDSLANASGRKCSGPERKALPFPAQSAPWEALGAHGTCPSPQHCPDKGDLCRSSPSVESLLPLLQLWLLQNNLGEGAGGSCGLLRR